LVLVKASEQNID